MKTNIAETTDTEIRDIIEKLERHGFEYVDQGYVEIDSPFNDNDVIGLALFPELLSYHDGKNWVTIPWICIKVEIEGEIGVDENKQIELVKWLVDSLKSSGITPFKDEDSFSGYSKRDQRKGYVRISLYVNPSFPDGFWSNHAL